MISRRKGLTYGLILAGALGLLTPQALVHLREEQSHRRELLEVSNFDPASGSAAAPARVIDTGRPGSDTELRGRRDTADVGGSTADPSGLAADGAEVAVRHSERYRPRTYVGASSPAESQRRVDELERSLQQIQNFVPSAQANELESMAEAWNLKSEQAGAGGADERAGGEPAEEEPSEADRPIVFETLRKPSESLLAYLETNTLLGTLVAGEQSAALLGGRVLRVGSSLPDDLGTLVAIERQSVTIAVDEIEVRVELPPLREARRVPETDAGPAGTGTDGTGMDDTGMDDTGDTGMDGTGLEGREPRAAPVPAAPAPAGVAEPAQTATDAAAQQSGQEGGARDPRR